MSRLALSLGCLLGFASFAPLLAQEGRSQQARDEVRNGETSAPSSDNGGAKVSVGNTGDPEADCAMGTLCCYALMGAVATPFAVPHTLLDDDFAQTRYFPRYPYQAGLPGYMVADPAASKDWCELYGDLVHPRNWAMRISVEEGYDFNGLDRQNGQLLFETASRFGVLANWNYFLERLPCGCYDDFAIGDVNLVYRFAQCEEAILRAGLGFRVLADRGRSDWGCNFTYGGDFFPMRPFIVSANLDLGSLGEAFVVHAHASAGVIYHGWELFVGYDFLRIGTVNLQGPMVGVRLWF